MAAPKLDEQEAARYWADRSMTIAERDELVATLVRQNVRGSVYTVPSRSHAGKSHTVKFHTTARQVECDCMAATHQQACGHAGAVVLAVLADVA